MFYLCSQLPARGWDRVDGGRLPQGVSTRGQCSTGTLLPIWHLFSSLEAPHTNICPTIYSLYCETVVKLSCVLSDYRAFTKCTIKIGQTPKLAKRLCGGSSSAINIVLPEQGTQQLCCIATTITQHPVRASLTWRKKKTKYPGIKKRSCPNA